MKKSLITVVMCLVMCILTVVPAFARVIWEDQILSQFPEPAYMMLVDGQRADEGYVGARYVRMQENINGHEIPSYLQHQGANGDRLWVRWGPPLVIEEGEYYIGLRVSTYRGDGPEKEMEYLRSYQLRVDGKEIPFASSSNAQYFEGIDEFGRVIVLTGEKVSLTRRSVIEASTDKRWLSITHVILWSDDIEQGPIKLQ